MAVNLIKRMNQSALHLLEHVGLAIIAIATVVATYGEVMVMINAQAVTLADLLLMFLYLEVLAMVAIYYDQGKLPIRFPLYIGMIALAGIIVRNAMLLVDFIHLELAAGRSLELATVRAAAVRARPIALTALAAMLGGFFILDDPIFGGLAVSLIFGLLVSTVLTLVVIPLAYYHVYWRRHAPPVQQAHAQ